MPPTVRGLNVLLICSVRLICQLDRLAWSFLVVAMTTELGWNTVEQGHVKAAFASGYLWLQIVGGVAGDRFGNKCFQVFAIAACAVGMAVVPVAIGGAAPGELHQETDGRGIAPWTELDRKAWSFSVARWVYFVMGLSCGPQHPTGTAMLAKWCLPREKAWVSSMDALSSIAGSLLSTLIIGLVIETLGWRATMRAMAVCTTIVLVFFCAFASDAPESFSTAGSVGWLRMSEEECQLFEDAGMLTSSTSKGSTLRAGGASMQQEETEFSPIKSVVTWESLQRAELSPAGGGASRSQQPLLQRKKPSAVQELFASPATWALFVAHATYNFVRYTIEQEMPKFFNDVLHTGHAKTGVALATLHVSAFVLSMVFERGVSSALRSEAYSLRQVRQRAAWWGFGTVALGSALMSMAASTSWLPTKPPFWAFTALLHVAWVGVTAQTFGHIGNYYDLTVGNTGLLMGVGNTIATIPSALSPLMVANTVHTLGAEKGWPRVMQILGAVAVCVGWVYSKLVEVDVVDGTDEAMKRPRRDASAASKGSHAI